MTVATTSWLGVDVGGPRKGFDVALIDDRRLLRLARRQNLDSVVSLVETNRPAVVAIDSPCCCAPEGATTREGERRLGREVCGIRWTPDRKKVHANKYYEWIVEGLALYTALEGGPEVIEVFPTASWTRWTGPRQGSRAAWTRRGLEALGLGLAPTNQDQRDAIAAAITAREYSQGLTETFGEIVVPLPRSGDGGRRALPALTAGRG
jgi:predicted nuclease with RNAse H fold